MIQHEILNTSIRRATIMKEKDYLRRFIFEEIGIRGEWVKLHNSWLQAKQRQSCVNNAVTLQFAESLAAAVLLSATIKFNGSLILQLQGNGSLKALVAQSSHDRKIRGWIRSDDVVNGEDLKSMMGNGYLVITIESDISEPYQGIVAVEENSLAENIELYFQQSEQLKTRLWLFADSSTVAGLLLQELPEQKHDLSAWERVEVLADTLTAQEMLSLDCQEMLYRLFNRDKIRLFDAEEVIFSCSCSREKVGNTLLLLGRQQLEEILLQNSNIEVNCQFCSQLYTFDKVDVENLLVNQSVISQPHSTQH